MKEHPIPQDITNYRFHIVGSMTLKQFGEVLVGVIIAFAIYQTNLIAIIKWPLIVLFFGGGLLTAFVPIEERPISHWLTTFFGIIYKPTQFFWKREQKIPEPFLYKGDADKIKHVQEVDLTPARRQRIKEFLNSTKAITPDPEDFTAYEQQQLSSVMNLFQTGPQTISVINPVNIQKPDLTVRVRSMRVTEEYVEPTPEVVEEVVAITAPEPPPILDLPLIEQAEPEKNIYLDAAQVAQDISIPETAAVEIVETKKEEEKTATQILHSDKQVFIADQQAPVSNPNAEPTTQATYNAALPFPDKPTEPNKLVGMVLGANNDIIPNAIVEIATDTGNVARAVKTNALGQFFITTPLKSGKYVVNVQKEGSSFEPIQVELKNKIVDPLEIHSK